MTDSMVERESREASLPSYPSVQATERSEPRRGALRIGARLAVRGLVVVGFAGVAWLLSSGAAHAAGSGEQHGAPHAMSAGNGGSGPLSPVTTVLTPVTAVVTRAATVTGVLVPVKNVTGALAETARPVTTVLHGVGVPVERVVAPIRAKHRSSVGVHAPDDRASGVPAAAGTDLTAGPPVVGVAAGRRSSVALRHRSPRPVTEVFGAKRIGAELPVLPRPGPAPAYPGSGLTGMPTNASGSQLEGGQYAVAPSTVASGAVACRRLSLGTEVEARRLIADVPTVSPD